MAANQYNPFESSWSLNDWNQRSDVGHYKCVDKSDWPKLPQSFLDKGNCAYISLSGNAQVTACMFQMYRVELKKGVIDEHQFVEVFDNKTKEKIIAGFIDHPDYSERTISLDSATQKLLNESGVFVEIAFDRKPSLQEGTLNDLAKDDLLIGFEHALKVTPKFFTGDSNS